MRGPSGFQLLQAGGSARCQRRPAAQHGHPVPAPATSWCASTRHRGRRRRPRRRSTRCAARIAGGADFAAVARKESPRTPTRRRRGGDLGWFAPDAFGPAFGAAGRGAGRRPGVRAVPHRGRLAHRPARGHAARPTSATQNRRAQVARDHRPPQAGRRVEPLPARDARRSLRRRAHRQRPPPSSRSRPPAAADVPLRAPARAGSGRTGRHRPRAVRAAGTAAARTTRWSPSATRDTLQAAADALGLPLRLLPADDAAGTARATLALVDGAQRRRAPRSARPTRATPRAVIARTARGGRCLPATAIRRAGHRAGAQGRDQRRRHRLHRHHRTAGRAAPAATW